MIICDFCSSTPVTHSYPARDIVIPDTRSISRGAWAACEACHDLIEAGDRAGLAVRCADTFELPEGFPPLSFEERISAATCIHGQFYKARTGSPKEYRE